jgi:murein DD-endopeptidase MepM/ murein hydrolase activator NlpD
MKREQNLLAGTDGVALATAPTQPEPPPVTSPARGEEMLDGKGYFVWHAEQVIARRGAGSADKAAAMAKAAGVEHVILKIADGTEPFPNPKSDPGGRKEAASVELLQALRSAGITVWGWAFVYGEGVAPETQAGILARRAQEYGLRGLVVNAEDLGERRWSLPGGSDRAREYMSALRSALSGTEGVTLALSSYRYLQSHPYFPFAAFMADCDIAMPQVYWVARSEGDAIGNLRRCYEQYKEQFPNKLFIPVGAAYGEMYGGASDRYFWSSSPRQIHRFLDQARAMGLPAVTFWSWEHALYDLGNRHYNGRELWDAVASYQYEDIQLTGSGVVQEVGADSQEQADSAGDTIRIAVGQEGYRDGVYQQFPYAVFIPQVVNGRQLKYARTVSNTPSSVWAWWRPDIVTSGDYEISVWVPGQHATARTAQYQIHGVVGENEPVIVYVNQNRFSDTWVSLGVYELDANNPASGQVNLTNFTGEEKRSVAFSDVRWRPVTGPVQIGERLADGFDAPVGTEEERLEAELWPGEWADANSFGNYYRLRDSYCYHTGSDLNLNRPQWDSDRGKPVYAAASGTVTFAGRIRTWGNVVVVRHDPLRPGGPSVYGRYAHLGEIVVEKDQRIQRGQQIGTVGRDEYNGPYHLHFDISPTEILFNNPGDWPGLDRARLYRDYLNPRQFIEENRPAR